MQKTSLYQKHIDLNAKMVDFAGWSMPIQYKNLKEEVMAVRNNVGAFDVSHMGEFLVTGPDAVSFMDYAITADLKSLPLGKALYSPLVNFEGKILDDLIVYKLEQERIFICVNAGNIEKDFNWLKDLKKEFNCELTNQSNKFSLIALQGAKSFEILKQLPLFDKLTDLDYYGVSDLENGIIIARTGYTGEDGFEIFSDHEIIQKIWDDLIKREVMPCGLGARDVLRLEVAYPLYGNDLTEDLTPLDCALKWTVKFNKENFVGKEALLNYQSKFKLIKLKLDKGIPRAGYNVLNKNSDIIGKVTSGTMSVKAGHGIALALIEVSKLPENGDYYIDIRNKKYPALRVTKPFVSGSHK